MKLAPDQLDFFHEADNRWRHLPGTNKEAILELIAMLLLQIILPDQSKQLQNKPEDNDEQ